MHLVRTEASLGIVRWASVPFSDSFYSSQDQALGQVWQPRSTLLHMRENSISGLFDFATKTKTLPTPQQLFDEMLKTPIKTEVNETVTLFSLQGLTFQGWSNTVTDQFVFINAAFASRLGLTDATEAANSFTGVDGHLKFSTVYRNGRRYVCIANEGLKTYRLHPRLSHVVKGRQADVQNTTTTVMLKDTWDTVATFKTIYVYFASRNIRMLTAWTWWEWLQKDQVERQPNLRFLTLANGVIDFQPRTAFFSEFLNGGGSVALKGNLMAGVLLNLALVARRPGYFHHPPRLGKTNHPHGRQRRLHDQRRHVVRVGALLRESRACQRSDHLLPAGQDGVAPVDNGGG